jgi:hypothetical protein
MNLASVQKIVDIQPIEGADAIEKVQVLGWWVVTKKGEYKLGDLCSYIQIDTIVPEREEYEFLRRVNFRVKTIRLRGQISQGLIVPLPKGKWNEGDDLTEILGVKKYSKIVETEDKPEKAPKIWWKKWAWLFKTKVLYKYFPSLKPKPNKFPFPSNIVGKTDEERIQNITKVLTTHKGKKFITSEKLDGSSITIIHERGKFRVCSRNYEMNNIENEWSQVFINTNFGEHIIKLVTHYNTDNIVVQGEYIGKPQGNPYGLKSNEIRLFNIYVNGKRLNQKEFFEVTKKFSIPVCPFMGEITLNHTLDELLKIAEGKSYLNDKTEREGLVFRCIEDNLSFKVISNKFLLKKGE